MRHLVCGRCGSSFPAATMQESEGEAYCGTCSPEVESGTLIPVADPTLCGQCGLDNGDRALEEVAGIPMCLECAECSRHYPIPAWVKVAALVVAGLAFTCFVMNWRFFMGYIESRQALRATRGKDLERAAVLMESASGRVPESAALAMQAKLFRGMHLVSIERAAEGAALLRELRDSEPPTPRLDQLILVAEANAAFEARDFDSFLEKSRILAGKEPRNSSYILMVASAQACKFAVTGDESFRKECLRLLEEAPRGASPGPAGPSGYRERILKRLETREILTRREHDRKYHPGKAEGDR